MMQEATTVFEAEPRPTRHAVYELMRFGTAVRHRKNIVLAALAAGVLLGALYFVTAVRYYAAKASLLVVAIEPAGELTSTSIAPEGPRQQLWMPTYEALITSAKVLEGAIQHLRPEDCLDMKDIPKGKWVAALRENLGTRTLRNTNIIDISYRSKSPAAAVAVVNAVVQSYIEFVDKTHKSNAGEIIRILTKEKAELAGKLTEKEQMLQTARAEVCDLGLGPENKVLHPIVQRAVSFNDALIETRKQRAKLESSMASLDAAMRSGADLQQQFLNLADVVGKELLLGRLGFGARDAMTQANLEQSLFENRAKLRSLQEHLGAAHPAVGATAERIRMGEEQLGGYQERINQRLAQMRDTQLGPMLAEMVQQQLQQTIHNEQKLQAQYELAQSAANSFSSQAARLDTIKHDLQWLRNLHDVLLNRIAGIDLKHEGQDVRATVVSEPQKSDTPVSPRLLMVVIVSLGGGLVVGLLVVYAADILDDRFRSAEELQSQMGVPVLSLVREMVRSGQGGLESLQVHASPDAAESESFRTLRTALSLLTQESRQVVISSAEPGDGKTTVLANLALSFAQSGKRTLLIDADLRRPGLTAMLGLRGADGLSGILRGEGKVVEAAKAAVWHSGVPGFDVIPSGPRPANPAELLAHARLSELLAWAEANYEQVFIDSAPALVTSDAAVIGRLVDGVLLVVQPRKNRRRQVARVLESFAFLKIPLLGLVVNRISPRTEGGYYYGYGGSDEYEDGYGHQEGDRDDGRPHIKKRHRERKSQAEAAPAASIPLPVQPQERTAPRRAA